ncbi:MAG TPA: MCE family protein [Mycobacterium sp.]|jgi:phospholipid/cholesterol/gamma-HCH transport system substrate-binding protein
MRSLQRPNRIRVGLMFIVITGLVIGVGQSFTSVPMLFARPSYYAQFADSGGVHPGDKVRIAGIDVGSVEDIDIDGDHVVMKFSVGTNTIGTQSRLMIRTDTILGKKVLEIEPRGNQPLRPGKTLPLGQSTTPYQIYDAFFDVTKSAGGWDIDTVKRSLDVLSHTVDQTYPHLSAALDGVARFSDSVGKRDEQINHLLAQAHDVANVLGDRSEQFDRLLVNAQELLAAFNRRSRAIDVLLERVSVFSTQLHGLIDDNPELHHVLEQLRTLTDVLVARKEDVGRTLVTLGKYTAALNEGLASGPYFKVMVANLLPHQILQPFIDAAFKKRGIDPENFWRGAGLPAFAWPDPNGTRFPNGAPPPAPPALEGTPGNLGPAVPPGSPCSYTPPPDGIPTATNPLPCAHLDQGPYGSVPGGYAQPNVAASPANPNGPGYAPGIPSAGVPGEIPPMVQGTPVPLPDARPGARTEPVGPVSGSYPAPAAPPALLPGPPPPPGPGPQVPDYPPPGVPAPVDIGGH